MIFLTKTFIITKEIEHIASSLFWIVKWPACEEMFQKLQQTISDSQTKNKKKKGFIEIAFDTRMDMHMMDEFESDCLFSHILFSLQLIFC